MACRARRGARCPPGGLINPTKAAPETPRVAFRVQETKMAPPDCLASIAPQRPPGGGEAPFRAHRASRLLSKATRGLSQSGCRGGAAFEQELRTNRVAWDIVPVITSEQLGGGEQGGTWTSDVPGPDPLWFPSAHMPSSMGWAIRKVLPTRKDSTQDSLGGGAETTMTAVSAASIRLLRSTVPNNAPRRP